MLTLSDGRDKITTTLTKPTGYDTGSGVLSVQLATLNGTGAIPTSDLASKADTRLSATGSDTFTDGPLAEEGNSKAFGASNFEGQLGIFRFLDADGKVIPAKDTLYTAQGSKGVEGWHWYRKGPKGKEPWAAGDEGWVYEATTDEPQDPSDRNGYIKVITPLAIRSRRRFKVTA